MDGPPERDGSLEPRRRRLRRWGLRALASVLGVAVVVACALAIVLSSLDRPWLKRRIVALARSSAGIDIDYAAARVSLFSGAAIDGLVVASPAEGRALAPELVRVGHVEAHWSLPSLLSPGTGTRVRDVTVSDVALTVLVDEHGRTSFDALSPPPTEPAPPPTPLSHQASVLKAAPVVGRIDVGRVSLTLLQTQAGRVAERDELRGVALSISTAPLDGEGWRLVAKAGSPAAPLDLQLARARSGAAAEDAHAKLWLAIDATPSTLSAGVDLRVLDQTLVAGVPTTGAIHAEATVRFDPAAKRTTIEVRHTQAIDGAATAEASVEVPDQGDAVVRHAQGDIDVARLLQWVPAGLVPVAAERAHVRYQIDGLVVGPVVRVSDGGGVILDAELANVSARLASGPVGVGAGKLSIRGRPGAKGGIAAQGTIELSALTVGTAGGRVAAGDLAVDLDGRQDEDGAITGKISARATKVESAGGASPVVAREARVDLAAQRLLVAADPLASSGDLAVSLRLASLDAGAVAATDVDAHIHAALIGHAPYAAEATLTASRLRVLRRDGAPLVDARLHLDASAHDVVLPLAHPLLARGVARVIADLGEAKTTVDLTKATDAFDFVVQASAPSLGIARPFLSPALASEAKWEQIGANLRAAGHVDRPLGADPAIRQTTHLEIARLAFDRVEARTVSLDLESHGTLLQHEARADLRAQGLAIDGGDVHDEHVTLEGQLDRLRPSLRVDLATEGRATAKLTASASFDPSRHAVPYAIDGHLAGLAGIAPFLSKVHGLEGFDLSQLELGISAHGSLLGAVDAVGRDGSVRLAPHPSRTAAFEGSADLRVAHFKWERGDDAVLSPAFSWHGDFKVSGEKRTVESKLEADAVHLDLGPHDVDLGGIRHESTVIVTGDLLSPGLALTQRTALGTVAQDYVPEYPTGDVSFAVTAERDKGGVVHVTDMKLANVAGGTTLGLTGNIDLGSGQRTLSVTTTLGQDLARLDRAPERFVGRGKLAMEANVTSPDLALFRLHAALKGAGVTFSMPRAHLAVDEANGEVPITLMLDVGKEGVSLRREPGRSPYSMLRFADQHPLLSHSGFLSVASLKTPLVTIAPLVGNLAIEQSEISLRQFEMGVRNGSITGQLGLDWDGPKSTLELHIRASGVQSSHGEPFDGNIAVVVAAGDRTVEGRADILRIGERHLLDLLDMQDPLHVDPAMNRIRTALKVGYPDRLRLVFDHGFASARLELGGLARLISIGELRGIPMGPIVDKFLTPLLDTGSAN